MQIVAISTNEWHGQWMGRQHLMWAMRNVCSVLYVQEPRSWHKGWRTRDERFISPDLENVTDSLRVLRLPKALCNRGKEGGWNRWTYHRKAKMIRKQIDDCHPFVLYLWHPRLWPYVDLLRPDFVVYHLYDLSPSFHRPEFNGTPGRAQFEKVCGEADLVVALNAEQAERMPIDNVQIVASGVHFEDYQTAWEEPDDMVEIARPRIGFSGSITDKKDFDWFDRISAEKQWQLVLLGPVRSINTQNRKRFEDLCNRDNVHYLGNKPAREVPSYIRGMDIGLLNYCHGTFQDYCSPMKLFEYAAAGLPMVGPKIPSLINDVSLHPYVELIDTGNQAVTAIRQFLRKPKCDSDKDARKRFAKENSWTARARRILSLIETRMSNYNDTVQHHDTAVV